MLEDEDFEVKDNIAINKEKLCTFEIEKSAPDEFSIIYAVSIKDKDGNVTKSRKFKSDLYHRLEILDTILNICAKYNEDLIANAHKDIDPYNEEDWDEKEVKKSKTPNFDDFF